MPRRLIKRYLPDPMKIRDHRHLRILGPLLHDPNILHLNRRSVSGAVGIGLFFAFWPIPFQMLLAAIAAIGVRVNLPISVALVWVTNPLTMPPVFYFAYLVGTWLMGSPPSDVPFEFSAEGIAHVLTHNWRPFLLGCLVCGSVCASAGYVTVRVLWRVLVQRNWDRRCAQRRAQRKAELEEVLRKPQE